MPKTTLRRIDAKNNNDGSLIIMGDLFIEPKKYSAFYGPNGLLKDNIRRKIRICGNEMNFLSSLSKLVNRVIEDNDLYNQDNLNDPQYCAGNDLQLMSCVSTPLEEWPYGDVEYICRNSDSKEFHKGYDFNITGEKIIIGNISVGLASATRYFASFRKPGERFYHDFPPIINIEIDCCNLCFKHTLPKIKEIISSRVQVIAENINAGVIDLHDPETTLRITANQLREFSRTEA